jgi:hypothetical protein
VKGAILILAPLLLVSVPRAQESTFRLTVLGYQWTTTHKTLTFSWPGHSSTSCNGAVNVNGNVSGGNIYASGTTSDTCSTTYTPPTNQNIEIQKPVVFILAETEKNRMVMTCTRNVRWSQCHALTPGSFLGRISNGHLEVQGTSGKGKEEWVKFDVVQQTAVRAGAGPVEASAPQPVPEALASIEAPKSETKSADFPDRWKSMTSGTVRTLRFEGDYIYGETVLTEAAAKAGVFFLMDVKKDGDKYVGKTNARVLKAADGPACSVAEPIELTLVTPERIEGRAFAPPVNAKIDWNSCTYSPPSDWQAFTWIPVK